MSRYHDAIENARSMVTTHRSGGLPAEPPRMPGAVSPSDLPLLRLWQGIELALAGKRRKVVQIVPCTEAEFDPAVAIRLARLVGRGLWGGVLVLDQVTSEMAMAEDGLVAFGPLPGRAGDARALNPALLSACWKRLGENSDLIILDTPPLLSSPLAQALAPTVDGVVLVVEAERTRAPVVEACRDALNAAGANLLGVVLNKRRYHVPKALYDRL